MANKDTNRELSTYETLTTQPTAAAAAAANSHFSQVGNRVRHLLKLNDDFLILHIACL